MDTTQAVARILKIEGVEWISCFPSNQLIEAVAEEGIRTVMFRHERGAVMAADGYSRVNNRNKFGVIITQGGPRRGKLYGRYCTGFCRQRSNSVPCRAVPQLTNMQFVRPSHRFAHMRQYRSMAKSLQNRVKLPTSCDGLSTTFGMDAPVPSSSRHRATLGCKKSQTMLSTTSHRSEHFRCQLPAISKTLLRNC